MEPIYMETISMELWYMYGNYKYGTLVWNTCMGTCLGLCMESMDMLVRKPS